MRKTDACVSFALLALAASGWAQQSRPTKKTDAGTALPKAFLWSRYSFQFQPSGDNGPYHWRIASGAVPRGLTLREDGSLTGETAQEGEANFAVIETDRTGKPETNRYTLATEAPLTASWDKRAEVSGNRIDGSIKVSNTSGRDFDLTFIVLAVNGIGRATAIGYQHFSLKANTRDQELPFGETLSSANYTVNVDVVGEEPQSKMIFRTRLVAGNELVTQGP